tara:strand:- start:296 stop:484 length:189 start_codon:yes stop_codon:yes gene_type:complete
MPYFDCKITLPPLYPRREAESREQFIEQLIEQYNCACGDLFKINIDDISEVFCEGEAAAPIK